MAEPKPNRVLRHLKSAVGPDAAGESDGTLLGRFADHRDESAFELILWRHTALVQRVCHHVLRDQQSAEDAAQATFLVLARKAGGLRSQESVVGWLYRVARRIAVRAAVSRGKRGGSSAGLDLLPATATTGTDADISRLVHDEIARLPERYRVPVLACLVEGLTHTDAANRLGWPVGTVAGRLSRAKAMLADRLTRRGVTAGAAAVAALGVESVTPTQAAFIATTLSAVVVLTSGGSVFPSVSSDALRLMKWEMKAVLATRLLKIGTLVAAFGLAAVGVTALAGKPADPPVSSKKANPPAAAKSEFPNATVSDRKQSAGNLKSLMLAVYSAENAFGHVPTDITDKDGKPLLSWRIRLLINLNPGGNELYKQFKFDEPWDSEHNKKLLTKMPDVFRSGTSPKGTSDTHFQAFRGPGAFLEPGKKLRFDNLNVPGDVAKVADDAKPEEPSFKDPLSQTFGIVEAGPPVPWTKPADIDYDPKKPFPKLAGPFADVLNVGFADGYALAIRRDLDEKTMRALVERSDGTSLDKEAFEKLKAKPAQASASDLKDYATRRVEYSKAQSQVLKLMQAEIRLREEIGDRLDAEALAEEAKQNASWDANAMNVESHYFLLQIEHLFWKNEQLKKMAEGLKKDKRNDVVVLTKAEFEKLRAKLARPLDTDLKDYATRRVEYTEVLTRVVKLMQEETRLREEIGDRLDAEALAEEAKQTGWEGDARNLDPHDLLMQIELLRLKNEQLKKMAEGLKKRDRK